MRIRFDATFMSIFTCPTPRSRHSPLLNLSKNRKIITEISEATNLPVSKKHKKEKPQPKRHIYATMFRLNSKLKRDRHHLPVQLSTLTVQQLLVLLARRQGNAVRQLANRLEVDAVVALAGDVVFGGLGCGGRLGFKRSRLLLIRYHLSQDSNEINTQDGKDKTRTVAVTPENENDVEPPN